MTKHDPISAQEDHAFHDGGRPIEPMAEPYGKRLGDSLIAVLEALNAEIHGADLQMIGNYIEDNVLVVAGELPRTEAHEAINLLAQWCFRRACDLDEQAAEDGAYSRDMNGHYGVGR